MKIIRFLIVTSFAALLGLSAQAQTVTNLKDDAASGRLTIIDSFFITGSGFSSKYYAYDVQTFTSTITGTIDISLVSSSFRTALYAYSASSVIDFTSLTSLTSNDLAYDIGNSGRTSTAEVSFSVTAGSTYKLLITSAGADKFGAYTLDFTGTATGSSSESPVVTAVPEPSTYGLMGVAGLGGIAFLRRRRKAQKA